MLLQAVVCQPKPTSHTPLGLGYFHHHADISSSVPLIALDYRKLCVCKLTINVDLRLCLISLLSFLSWSFCCLFYEYRN